jgi:cyclophilin family peptidyl-prolyl cis-trans isomerase/chitodextrinase
MVGSAGCDVLGPLAPAGLRTPPAIIPSSGGALARSFTVDLRRYPEANRITWEFGDGAMAAGLPVASGRTVTHEFPQGGVYNVRVHLFGPGDLENPSASRLLGTGNLPVEVRRANSAPVPAFLILDVRASDNTIIGRSRRFDAGNSRDVDGPIASYAWAFGDGETATGPVIQHDYLTTGRFTVTLTVTDEAGASASLSRTVFINNSPVADFEFAVTDDPAGLTVRFDGTDSSDPDGSIAEFRWNFGDNTPEASGAVVTHTYAVPDSYTVTLRITDSAGTTVSTQRSVQVTGQGIFVRSVTPNEGEVDTLVDVLVSGENFRDTATVRLVRNGVDVFTDVFTNRVDIRTLRATLNLTGLALGDYDLVVQNAPGRRNALTNGFRVVTPNRVRLTTTLGDVVIELVDDAPITTQNFLQYAADGFYTGTIFHRVVPGFVVQGGGFLPGNVPPAGLRPPIQNEFSPSRSNIRGTLAMAKLGGDPNSATSQFFFNLGDNSANLDNQNGGFTVFARVVEGMNVVDAIAAVPLNGEMPVTDVVLTRVRRE